MIACFVFFPQEHDHVIGIAEHEALHVSGLPERVQPVQIDIGEQGRKDAALRGAFPAASAAVIVRFCPWRPHGSGLNDGLDQSEKLPVDDALGDEPEEFPVGDGVETISEIDGADILLLPLRSVDVGKERVVEFRDRLVGAFLRTVAVGVFLKVRLEDGLDDELDGHLDDPVLDRGDFEQARFPVAFRDSDFPELVRPVGLVNERLPDIGEERFRFAGLFQVTEGLLIDAGGSFISFYPFKGFGDDVLPLDFVVEAVELVCGVLFCLEI